MSCDGKTNKVLIVTALFIFTTIAGCGHSRDQLLATSESQLKIRSIQTRAFDTTNKEQTLRTVMATMQDLGFVIDNADLTLGTVSGTKLSSYNLKMTVTVRPKGSTQLLVRANAQFNVTTVEDPEPYQQFFTSLGRAMFLEAQQVE